MTAQISPRSCPGARSWKPGRGIISPHRVLQIRAYMNKFSEAEDNHSWDLLALRFLSINSIVDPWVFAILRPPVLRFMRSVLCCQVTPASQDRRTPSPAKTKLAARLDPGGQ